METVNTKTAVTLVCLALILIAVSVPLLLGKVKMNAVYGFRFRKAFESDENWYLINSYGAKALIRWALLIMITGIAGLYIEPEHVLTVGKMAFLSLLVPAVQTALYAKRL